MGDIVLRLDIDDRPRNRRAVGDALVIFGFDLAPQQRFGAGLAAGCQIPLHGDRGLTDRFDLVEHLFGKPAAEQPFQFSSDLQSLQRIQSQIQHNVGIQIQLPRPLAGNLLDRQFDRLDDWPGNF